MLEVLALFSLFLYFAPSIVAVVREHPKATTLFLLNLCFGWSVIGWLGVMVWAWAGGKSPD